MELTQKAFALATAIRVDPFAIERQLPTIKVAVKLLRTKSSAPDKEEFLAEAEMMLSIDSEFFIRVCSFVNRSLLRPALTSGYVSVSVQALGVCVDRKPWLLVTEFMAYKDLGVVLRQCKKAAVQLRTHEIINYLLQVARGLEYLAKVRVDSIGMLSTLFQAMLMHTGAHCAPRCRHSQRADWHRQQSQSILVNSTTCCVLDPT